MDLSKKKQDGQEKEHKLCEIDRSQSKNQSWNKENQTKLDFLLCLFKCSTSRNEPREMGATTASYSRRDWGPTSRHSQFRSLWPYTVDEGIDSRRALMSLSRAHKAILKWETAVSAEPRGWGKNSAPQCLVQLHLWSTSSEDSCTAHLWSALPGTCINWAHNWIVVFISSSPLLAILCYGLLGLMFVRASSRKSSRRNILFPVSSPSCRYVTDEKQLSLTADRWHSVCSPSNRGFSRHQRDAKQPLGNGLLNGNNRTKPLIFLWMFQAAAQKLYLQEG